YAMAPYLSRFDLSVDQLDGPRPQIGVAAVGRGALDAVPRDPLEPAGDRAGRAVGLMGGHVERDPADYVVDRVRPCAAQPVVDGEEQDWVRVHPLLQRVLDEAVVPLRAGIGEIRADRQIARVAVEDPVREGLAAGAALAALDVQQVERARCAGL